MSLISNIKHNLRNLSYEKETKYFSFKKISEPVDFGFRDGRIFFFFLIIIYEVEVCNTMRNKSRKEEKVERMK